MSVVGENAGRNARRATFSVRGVDCATCSLAIEKRLRWIAGIRSVGCSIMLNKVFVDYDPSVLGLPEIMKAIDSTGYSSKLTTDQATA